MRYNELTNLLLKVAGAVLAIYAITGIPSYVSYYFTLRISEDSALLFFLMTVLPFLIPLLFGAALLFYPRALTNRIIKVESGDQENGLDLSKIEILAFRVLGLYLMFMVISDFSYNFSYLFQIARTPDGQNSLNIDTYARIVATVAEFLFALYLLFGAIGMQRLFAKVRGR